jgi:hypothetical protein
MLAVRHGREVGVLTSIIAGDRGAAHRRAASRERG